MEGAKLMTLPKVAQASQIPDALLSTGRNTEFLFVNRGLFKFVQYVWDLQLMHRYDNMILWYVENLPCVSRCCVENGFRQQRGEYRS